MSSIMIDSDDVEEFAAKIAKGAKTPEALAEQFKLLKKMTLEKLLEEEMNDHLGYEKHSSIGKNKNNSRNGYTSKTIRT